MFITSQVIPLVGSGSIDHTTIPRILHPRAVRWSRAISSLFWQPMFVPRSCWCWGRMRRIVCFAAKRGSCSKTCPSTADLTGRRPRVWNFAAAGPGFWDFCSSHLNVGFPVVLTVNSAEIRKTASSWLGHSVERIPLSEGRRGPSPKPAESGLAVRGGFESARPARPAEFFPQATSPSVG